MNESMRAKLEVGSVGERVVWDYLQHQPNVRTVFDVRLAKKYQEMDVDFEVEFLDRSILWVEVKTDEQIHQTGNIFYEFVSNENYDTQGCFEKTKADVMLIYESQTGGLYQISVPHLKKYVETNCTALKTVKGGDHANGYLVKMDNLMRMNIARRMNK